MGWIFAAAAGLGVLAAVLLSNIRIQIFYKRERENDRLVLNVKALFGLVSIPYQVPELELRRRMNGIRMKVEHASQESSYGWNLEELESMIRTGRLLLQQLREHRKWIEGSLQHIHVDQFHWETQIGARDAAETGFLSGILWGGKGAALSFISRWLTMEARPILAVSPAYQAPMFQTRIDARLHIRAYRLLQIGLMLLLRILRKKGGLKVWWKVLTKKKAPQSRTA